MPLLLETGKVPKERLLFTLSPNIFSQQGQRQQPGVEVSLCCPGQLDNGWQSVTYL